MFKNIPPVTRNLLFINIIIFMLQMVVNNHYGVTLNNDVLTETFGLHFYLANNFHIWQLVTYMFLHGSWSHVLMNMFSLWMFGRIIEQTMSQKRFLIYYLVCGIGAALCQELWQTGEYFYYGLNNYSLVNTGMSVLATGDFLNSWATIGASGAVYGILLAFGMTFPNERIVLLFPPIPMKAKYFVCAFAVIEFLSAFASNGNIAHFAHLGGMFFGFLLIRYWRKKASRPQFTGWSNYAQQQNRGYNRGTYNNMGTLQRISAWFQNLGASLEEGIRSIFGGKKNTMNSKRYDNPDHEYNARRNEEKKRSKEQQERIDKILDKVRRSGYDSLTEEEKRELFDNNK